MGDILGPDAAEFEAGYNRDSFAFTHALQSDSLFSLDALRALARRRPENPELVYWSNGTVGVGDTWSAGVERRATLCEALDEVAQNDSLIMFKRVELDPEYAPTLQRLMNGLITLSGIRMAHDVRFGRGTILVASPRRITSYHFDADTNFLFQMHGTKVIRVYGNRDRSLVNDVHLERYFAGDLNPVTYKPEELHKSTRYLLGPGAGVHIPFTAPHWAQNGEQVSVALSVNFELRSVERMAHLSQMNRRLRTLGLEPSRPADSPMRDELKLAASSVGRRLKHLLHPRPGGAG